MVFFIDNLLNVDQLKCVFLHVEVLNNQITLQVMVSKIDKELGLDTTITRRDFVYGSSLVLGSAVVGCGESVNNQTHANRVLQIHREIFAQPCPNLILETGYQQFREWLPR